MPSRSKTSVSFMVLVITASLGTLTAATIAMAAAFMVYFVLPVLFLPYLVWWLLARHMKSKGCLRPLSVWVAIPLTVVMVPFFAVLPYQIARYELRLRTADMPIPAQLRVTDIVADPFGNTSTGAGIDYVLTPETDSLEALQALEDKLIDEGWDILTGGVPRARGFGIDGYYRGPLDQSLLLSASWDRTLHEYTSITLRRMISAKSPSVLFVILFVAALVCAACPGLKRRPPDEPDT